MYICRETTKHLNFIGMGKGMNKDLVIKKI